LLFPFSFPHPVHPVNPVKKFGSKTELHHPIPIPLKTRLTIFLALLLPLCAFAEQTTPALPSVASAKEGLAAGPLVGYSEMREVALWVQTKGPATVQIAYWPKNQPALRELTPAVQTRDADDDTAVFLANRVTPGTRYEYQVLLNGQPLIYPYITEFVTLPDWRNRTDPPDFTVAFAAGNSVYDPAIDLPSLAPEPGTYSILTALLAQRPEALVWLGGATWLREPDWGSRTGYSLRYANTRALPELQPLIGSVHQYAVVGAPDFGPPDASANLWNLHDAQTAFRRYWPNPSYGVARLDGLMTTFRWGDAEFFLLDDRSFRHLNDENGVDRAVLGHDQIAWLLDALRSSTATFKIVCAGSPLLNPADDSTNLAAAPSDREMLLNALHPGTISGVLFLSGGLPYGELTRLLRPQSYDLFDLTVGPLTAKPANGVNDPNFLLVPGSQIAARQFATLHFSGPPTQRTLTLGVFDAQGRQLYARALTAQQLTMPPAPAPVP
jgi:alkaline phosphatase D